MTFWPFTECPCASQMNLREEAKPKSRTFSAWKTQVFVPFGWLFSFAKASAGVTIITGDFAVSASFRRAICVGVSTSLGLCRTPVAETT